MFLCQELIEFILEDPRTWKDLTPHDYSASVKGSAFNGVYWNYFSNALVDALPRWLSRFFLYGTSRFLHEGEIYGKGEKEVDVIAEAKEACEILQGNPCLLKFAPFYSCSLATTMSPSLFLTKRKSCCHSGGVKIKRAMRG